MNEKIAESIYPEEQVIHGGKKKFSPTFRASKAGTLLSWYSSQQLKVRWCNDLSDPFSTFNGVRQGGVLSPILFTIYIDDLLTTLENNGVGCFWKHHYVGAVCYADDVALLIVSTNRLQGTGIRLEDDVLITDGLPEVLNKDTPDTLDEL